MKLKERLSKIRKGLTSKLVNVKSWGRGIKSLIAQVGDIVRHKHRFVVMDSETFKEKFSFQLSGINLFVTVGISVIILIVLTTILIAFTPLREYIPGYQNSDMVEQTYHNAQIIDSLERRVATQEWMIANIQDVLEGKTMPGEDDAMKRVDSLSSLGISVEEYRHSKDDSLLRAEIEQQTKQASASKSQKKTKKKVRR